MNILLNTFDTPFESVPFSKITNQDFAKAIPLAIENAKEELEIIINNKEAPNFYNTIEALENSGKILGKICGIFFNLNSAETNDELQSIAQSISPLLSEYQNDVLLNQKLFSRIKSVWECKEKKLNTEELRLLETVYKKFTRNGAKLNPKDKEILREIDKELALLSLKFGENVLAETNQYFLQVESEMQLLGLPDGIRDAAKSEAEERKLEGWVFTLQYPSYMPFMKYCADRSLRKEISEAFGSKCYKGDKFDNQNIIQEKVKLRTKRAQLLGYKNHADFVLEERMAKSPEKVLSFLSNLLDKAKPIAEKEIAELSTLAKSEGIESIESYDHAYYAEKLRQEKFAFDEEKFRNYFPLDKVEKGMFTIAEKLYGLSFVERTDIEVYHKDVKVYEVLDKIKIHKGLFYVDYFPRKGKRSGAWMTSYQSQQILDGKTKKPQVSIVCNFTKPTDKKPSLLTFDEVTTLFHEFGHALHGLLANNKYESLASPNVLWDFVELPSQFMENYCYEKEALDLFAEHYQTGEKLDDGMIKILKNAAIFLSAYQTIRQVGLARLDMAWHSVGMMDIEVSVSDFEKEATKETLLYPNNDKTNTSCSFAHIFQGGYSAGYYSYKWAEVLDADAFYYFKEKGIFDATTSQKFRTLLESGNTKEPMELYIDFRGQEPNEKALLVRAGLIES